MKRIPGLCPDCPVQTGYSQHSPGQTLFLNAKGYTLNNVNNIVCAQNYIRKSDYKVCHGTVWVKINYVFFNQLPEAELLFVIEEKKARQKKMQIMHSSRQSKFAGRIIKFATTRLRSKLNP